jgi:hypothetical protein
MLSCAQEWVMLFFRLPFLFAEGIKMPAAGRHYFYQKNKKNRAIRA